MLPILLLGLPVESLHVPRQTDRQTGGNPPRVDFSRGEQSLGDLEAPNSTRIRVLGQVFQKDPIIHNPYCNYKVRYTALSVVPITESHPRTMMACLPMPLLALLVKHARLLSSGSRRLPGPSIQYQESQTLSLRNYCMASMPSVASPVVSSQSPSFSLRGLQGGLGCELGSCRAG